MKEACCQYLRSQLCLDTVAATLSLAAAHDCADLLADAVRRTHAQHACSVWQTRCMCSICQLRSCRVLMWHVGVSPPRERFASCHQCTLSTQTQSRFFEGHFSQLLKSEDAASLAVLPPDLLRSLLSSDGLCIQSELDVARAALLWAAADPQQRGPLLPELLPAARMPPGLLAQEAARSGLLGSDSAWLLQVGTIQPGQQQQQREAPPPQPPTPQQGRSVADVSAELELGHAFVAACQQLQRSQPPGQGASGGGAAAGCGIGAEAALVAYRPRLSSPTGLMMAGGLDGGWRALR